MTIVLLGYMASGKSSVSKLLGKTLALPVVDLDDFIEMKEEMSIRTIFDSKGEIYFRTKEHQYLKEILEKKEAVIISLGGGTPCYAGNMHLIHQYTSNTFYLQTSIPEIINRVKNEKAKRPLISAIADEDLAEFIGKHLFERNVFYQQATHTITTDKKSVETLVAEIANLYISEAEK